MTSPANQGVQEGLGPRAAALLELLVAAVSSGHAPDAVTGIGGSRFQFLSLSKQSGEAIIMHPDLPRNLPNGRRGIFASPRDMATIVTADIVEIVAGSIESGWAIIDIRSQSSRGSAAV